MPEVHEQQLDNWTFYLSFADIAKLDICKGGNCSNLTKRELLETLWNNGMDIIKDYSFIYDNHRCLDGAIMTTQRVIGTMRTDQEWVDKFGSNIHAVLQELKSNKKYQGSDQMYATPVHPQGSKEDEDALKQDSKDYMKIHKQDIKRKHDMDRGVV